jgi:CPA2 family monovalent cation:H+ antiporter-2
MHESTFLFDLALVLGVGAATSVIARVLHQPSVLGYLVAGLIVGPYLPLPLFADPERIDAMAEFGVVLVMFAIGLEFRIAKLMRVVPVAGLTALLQMSALMWAGFSLGRLLGWSVVEAVFLGAAISISSTMVVSRVFDQVHVSVEVRELVLGVLIFQDVGAVVLIALTTAIAVGGSVAPTELAETMGWLLAALAGMLGFGMLIVPRAVRAVARLDSREILSVFSIGLCFVLAALADELGYSVALGAFLAGILVAESGHAHGVAHGIEPVRDMFAAVFFVSIGMSVDPVLAWRNLPVALFVFAVVVVGQLMSVTVAGILSGNGLSRSITAGLALGQIGEFGFILAGIGVTAGAVEVALQPILVTVATASAFTTPILLGFAPRVVHFVDRRLPHRAQWLLGLHEAWLQRFRERRDRDRGKSPIAHAVRALAFDAVLLNLILALSVTLPARSGDWVASRLSIPPETGRFVWLVLAVVIAVPLVVGLVRNSLALARLAGESILAPDVSAPTPATRVAAHSLRTLVLLAALAGVGAPTVALLRPLAGGLYGAFGLALLTGGVALYLWRDASAMAVELRSGAERLTQLLAEQSGQEEPMPIRHSTLPPGLDSILALTLRPHSVAVGRTLSDINLRAKTGATVLAIQRDGSRVILPTGRERLEVADVLAISGSRDAVLEAQKILNAATG